MRHRLGLLLSVDALLLDVHDARAQAWVEALAERGVRVRFPEVRQSVTLAPHELLNLTLGAGLDTPLGNETCERARTIFGMRYLSRIPPRYRARELLQAAIRSGMRVIVVSADSAETLLPILKKLEAESLIHRAIYPSKNDRVGSRRDLLRVALERAALTNKAAIQLTDSPDDVDGAAKLGVQSVALLSGGWTRNQLRGATIYDSPKALLESFETSPFASDPDDTAAA
ncbi:MAG: HAD family hydrolase [Deltaproteobacteria bacterium]|nr:HAD family hydrolase [Deltaproteobacteria bacterium]